MGILDDEPCRYCGLEKQTHAMSCEVGAAMILSYVRGAKAERKEVAEKVWQHIRQVRDDHDLDEVTYRMLSELMGWVQEDIV